MNYSEGEQFFLKETGDKITITKIHESVDYKIDYTKPDNSLVVDVPVKDIPEIIKLYSPNKKYNLKDGSTINIQEFNKESRSYRCVLKNPGAAPYITYMSEEDITKNLKQKGGRKNRRSKKNKFSRKSRRNRRRASYGRN
jgi:hypothetical protein